SYGFEHARERAVELVDHILARGGGGRRNGGSRLRCCRGRSGNGSGLRSQTGRRGDGREQKKRQKTTHKDGEFRQRTRSAVQILVASSGAATEPSRLRSKARFARETTAPPAAFDHEQ